MYMRQSREVERVFFFPALASVAKGAVKGITAFTPEQACS